ncbi:MAG: dihydroorotate dehydrogenase (quinone) [Alphaproteobacteria bacterium]
MAGFFLKKMTQNPWNFLGPVLKGCNPETARKWQHWLLKDGSFSEPPMRDDPILKVSLWNRNFPNPIGVAAGYDPDIEVIDDLSDVGFGFGEVGTITIDGEKVKRATIRLSSDLAISDATIGFPNDGAKEAAAKLTARRARKNIVGVSIGEGSIVEIDKKGEYIGKTDPVGEYEKALRAVAPFCDYVTINISAINMASLLEYQVENSLNALLSRLRKAIDVVAPITKPALLLKVSADLSDLSKEATAKCAIANNIDGIVVAGGSKRLTETLTSKKVDTKLKTSVSGQPLFEVSTHLIKEMYYHTQGQIPIIGVGGVFSGKDAYLKIRAGASLVQVYSAIIYNGPYVVKKIRKELAALLRADGFQSVQDAVGYDMRQQ